MTDRAPERWSEHAPEDPRARRAALLLGSARPTDLDADGVARVRRKIARSIGTRRRRGWVFAVVAAGALASAGIAAAAPGVWTAIARALGGIESPRPEAPTFSEPAPAVEPPALEERAEPAEEASPVAPPPDARPRARARAHRAPSRAPMVPVAPAPVSPPATAHTSSSSRAFLSEIEALERAVAAHHREDWEGALRALDQYARAYPQGELRGEAQLLALDCDLRLDRTDDALRILEAIELEGHPRRQELEVLRARLSSRPR